MSDQVRDLLPEAAVVQLTESCADRKLEVVTEEAIAADAEPDIPDMFRDYLADLGTKGAAADRVLDTFRTLLAAVTDNDVPVLPEEELLSQPIETCQTHTPAEAAS